MQSPGLADKVAVLPFNHPGLIATTLIGRIMTCAVQQALCRILRLKQGCKLCSVGAACKHQL